jgi:hypothetical protein
MAGKYFRSEPKEIMRYSVNRSYLYEEAVLVRIASAGDLDASNQLILRYQNMAYNHTYTLLGDRLGRKMPHRMVASKYFKV